MKRTVQFFARLTLLLETNVKIFVYSSLKIFDWVKTQKLDEDAECKTILIAHSEAFVNLETKQGYLLLCKMVLGYFRL